MEGKWRVLGQRDVYENEWATVSLYDVELPDGSRHEHHIVHRPIGDDAATMLAINDDGAVLMIWRHRVAADAWGWELPAGMVGKRELPKAAAARECQEETGWKVADLQPLLTVRAAPGLMPGQNFIFTSKQATWIGPEPDVNEVSDLAWLTVAEIDSLMAKGDISECSTLAALLYAMRTGVLAAG